MRRLEDPTEPLRIREDELLEELKRLRFKYCIVTVCFWFVTTILVIASLRNCR